MMVKKEKMKKAKKGEGKVKGKAIIGIAIAAIMLASVIVVMVQMGSAVSKGDNFNYIGNHTTPQKVLNGQNLQFNQTEPTNNFATKPTVYRYVAGDLENTYVPDANWRWYNVNWPTTGAYYASDDPTDKQGQAMLSVEDPNIPLKLKVGTKEVSSLTLGTNLTIDTGGINLFDNDKVDLEIIGPDGKIIYKNNQDFSNITVTALKAFGTTNPINTTGWKIGSYTFQIKTKSAYACGLSASSAVKTLTILKGEIAINAEKTTVTELETIKLTVTGVPDDTIWLNATPSSSHVLFVGGVEDTPASADGRDNFEHTIDADGKRTYAVKFNETGAYTIKVTAKGGPRDGYSDTVDITVSEKRVTFDVPTTVVIGEKLTIKGTANTGERVTIAVEDKIYDIIERLVIDENGEFSKEIDTSTACSNAFAVPGSVRLKAYIDAPDLPDGADVPATWTDDGTAVLLMARGGLTAELSATSVAHEDDFTVSGTAKGARSIDIVIVAPNGSDGSTIEPGGSTLDTTNIYYAITSVSEIDDTFSKKVTVGADVDDGSYLVVVLSPGSDGIYGVNSSATNVALAVAPYTLTGKTQEQILAIIEDATYGVAGSDDLYWVGYINVGSAFVTLNPIASVASGEPLIVTGTTNREEGFALVVTVEGPVHLTPQTVTITKGTFSATFDTTGAPAGIYTVKADDGDGHTDTKTVEILPPITPTSMRLHEHWNFISVPKKLAAGNDTFGQVFDSVNTSGHSIFYYNITEGWSAVTATEAVKPLKGYWIYSANDTVLNLTYDTYPLRTPPTRPLYKGWNAIGFSDITAAATNSALTSIEKSWAYLLGFNAATQEYESAIINNDDTGGAHDEDNSMYPMKGYWVYVTEDCELAGISV
ncbi:MAG: hypothetical protein WBC40_02585 [Halobacteriota archaeon]